MLEQSWQYYSDFCLCFLIILLYGNYRCNHPSFKDPLQKIISNSAGIDMWSITHLLFYMYIGYYYPDTFEQSMTIGILWEIFEFLNGKYRFKIFNNFGHCAGTDNNLWWYGKYSDLLMNATGFLIGKKLSNISL